MIRKRKSEEKIGQLGVRASIVPDSVNEAERTVEVVFATDSPVTRHGWTGKWIEKLSIKPEHMRMDRLNGGVVPLLDNHNSWSGSRGVLGSVREVRIADGKATCTIAFADTPDVEETWAKVRQGHIKGISVGYRVHKYEEQNVTVAAGPNADRSEETPEFLAVDWEPMEVSIAPIPADFNSATRSVESDNVVTIIRNIQQSEKMKRSEIIAMLTKRGIHVDAEATDEELLATLERAMTVTPPAAPAPAAAPAAAPAPVDTDAVRAAERARVTEITTICRKAGMDDAAIDSYVTGGTSIEAVRAAVIEKYQSADPNAGATPGVSVGRDRETEGRRNAMTEGMILRSASIVDFKPTDAQAAEQYRNSTLLDIAKRSLDAIGIDYRMMGNMEIVQRAITSSGSDLPILLDGTNRRVLLAAYSAIADTWRQFCSIGSVGDFRDYKRLKMGSMFSRLDQVNENGEYKTKALTDATAESIRVNTFGNLINVSRQMIINDDLNGVTRLAQNFGRAAARSIEKDVYALLALNGGLGPVMSDGNTLFHASHGNITTGVALSVDGLQADRVSMANQMDKDGNDFLGLAPDVLLLPIALGANARVYNNAEFDPDATGKYAKPNTVRGLFGTIVDTPRLSGTRRYMFANPATTPTLEVAFLNGVQTPFMESQEAFNQDGMSWKIRHDYGVAAVDWQGAVTNAGA
jgi:phage head maturation protease